MSQRLRVLHVIPFLWSGAGAVVTRLCESQCLEHDVHLVTSRPEGDLRDWPAYRRRIKAAGVSHHQIDLFSRTPDRIWPEIRKLADLLRRIEPGIIHAHAGTPTLASALARGLAGLRLPLVGQMYSWGVGRPSWMDDMDACGFGLADRVVVSADAYRRRLVQLGVDASRIDYIPWGLPLEELDAAGRAERPGTKGPRIGFVGRIEPRKGQLELARAFCAIAERHPSARLDLIGPVADAGYAAKIRAEATAAGLEDRVRLRGHVRDPWRIVRSWDLFVSLSSDEGQGLAILEAMALGVPVIARSAAGVDDYLVAGRNGIALASSRSREVAAAVSDALETPARLAAMARRARLMVQRRYAWSVTVAAFDALYAALVGRPGHRTRREPDPAAEIRGARSDTGRSR